MVITTQTLHVKALGHDINVHQLLTNYRLGIGPVKNYGLEREDPLSHHQRVDKVNTIETMFRLGIELDKELHKIDNDYESNMDDKIKQLEGKINSSNNNKRKKRK
jgi:Leu/Phe-tRNA-protein transferase